VVRRQGQKGCDGHGKRREVYTQGQISEWNALFDFHDKYTTADSVPHMPIVLSLGGGRFGNIIGAPIAWAELWQVLKTHARDRGGQMPGPADGDITTPVAVAARKQEELPLHNGVTGGNLPRAQRRAAAMRQAESEGTDALEETLPADNIQDKKLYFIETADGVGEGEFKVGIARVQGAARANGAIPVAWFTRKYTKSAAWGNGLALVPWMAPALAGQRIRRVGTSD